MNEITHQDCQDLQDMFNDINHALVLKMNEQPGPHQPLVNEAHQQRVTALRNWLDARQGKVLTNK